MTIPSCGQVWLEHGIMFISDLYDKHCLVKDWNSLTCQAMVNWFDWRWVLEAIPTYWKILLQKETFSSVDPRLFDILCETRNVSQRVYGMLIDHDHPILKYANLWILDDLPNFDIGHYEQEFQNMWKIMKKNKKYRSFQYRCLSKKLAIKTIYSPGVKKVIIFAPSARENQKIHICFMIVQRSLTYKMSVINVLLNLILVLRIFHSVIFITSRTIL